MIVGLDVGNTAVKVFHRQSTTIESIPLASPDWEFQTLRAIAKAFSRTSSPLEVRVASVNQKASSRLMETLISDELAIPMNVRIISHIDLGLKIQTDAPERVGIDRLLGAYGAIRRFPCPLMVVDAGTTVTIDYVDEDKVYRGGAILPGLEMQTRALAAGTDALPHLDWRDESCCGNDPPTSPGRNTLQAIRLGIFSSVVGAIERLHRSYGSPPRIIVTGGDAECLAAAIEPQNLVHIEPQLVARTLVGELDDASLVEK